MYRRKISFKTVGKLGVVDKSKDNSSRQRGKKDTGDGCVRQQEEKKAKEEMSGRGEGGCGEDISNGGRRGGSGKAEKSDALQHPNMTSSAISIVAVQFFCA